MEKNEVYEFIKSKVGVPIQDNTRFFHDIGIDGLDALTLMEEITDKFDLDMSNYNHDNYAVDEANIANPLRLLKKGFKKENNGGLTFTAAHLYDVILKRKWFDPV